MADSIDGYNRRAMRNALNVTMKKHVGMSKSQSAVTIDGSCYQKINESASYITGDSSEGFGKLISDLISCTTLVEQITAVKCIVNTIETLSEQQSTEGQYLIQILITLYLNPSLAKSSLQKTIGSSLDSLHGKLTKSHGKEKLCIKKLLQDFVCSISASESPQEYIYAVKCLIESQASSIRYQTVVDNLTTYCGLVASCLLKSLELIDTNTTEGGDENRVLSEDVGFAHTVCQVFLRLLTVESTQAKLDSQLQERLTKCILSAILAGCGHMDLLISLGLTLAQLISQKALSEIAENSEDNLQSDKYFVERMEDLMEMDEKAVVEKETDNSLSALATCCLLNGVICCQKQHGELLHKLVLNTVSRLIKKRMYTTTLLVFMKSLATWTNSLRVGYGELVQSEVFPTLLPFLFIVWEHSAETVRQSTREVFANLLKCVKSNDKLRLESLETVTGYPWTQKGKYGFLMEYVQVCGAEETLLHVTSENSTVEILEHVIQNIHQQQLANYVSEFVYCMMVSDKKSHSYTQTEWTDRWLKPLVTVVHKYPECQKHVSQNLIPKIIKVWPGTIVDLLRWLSHQPASSSNLLMYLMLSRRARTGGLLTETAATSTDQEDTQGDVWCGVLSRQLVSMALKSADSERRLSAFALVCESHKTASPISDCEFAWVHDYIRDNSFQAEPSFRQQMLAHLKHFLYHVLESSRKLDSQQQTPYKNFLKVLGAMQLERLKPEAIANHRSVALEILTMISNIFPHGTFQI